MESNTTTTTGGGKEDPLFFEDKTKVNREYERVRAAIQEQEEQRWLQMMNPYEYRVFLARQQTTQSQAWVDTVTEMRVRSDTIKAKVKDLVPELVEITDADFNFINRKKGKALQRQQKLAEKLLMGKGQKDDDGDGRALYRKVLPIEPFNPPATPENEKSLSEFEHFKEKLKTTIRLQTDMDKIETLCRIALDRYPIELEMLISQGMVLVR